MNKTALLGFFRRDDGTEYIFYEMNGKKHLTNGVCDWVQKATEFTQRDDMHTVRQVNTEQLIEQMKKNMPYSYAINLIKQTM